MTTIRTRMGDGHAVEMTADEIRADVLAGTEDAADRGRIPALTEQECDWLVELFCRPDRIVGVEQ
jgi:dimethylamine--corrinoid protein Co-methyltransferase